MQDAKSALIQAGIPPHCNGMCQLHGLEQHTSAMWWCLRRQSSSDASSRSQERLRASSRPPIANGKVVRHPALLPIQSAGESAYIGGARQALHGV
jgi:hypothetical protein